MQIHIVCVTFLSLVHGFPEPPGYSYPKAISITDFKPPPVSSEHGYLGDESYSNGRGGGDIQIKKQVHLHKIFINVAPAPQPAAEKIIIKQPASIIPQSKHLKILFKNAPGSSSSSSSSQNQQQPQRTVYEVIKKSSSSQC